MTDREFKLDQECDHLKTVADAWQLRAQQAEQALEKAETENNQLTVLLKTETAFAERSNEDRVAAEAKLATAEKEVDFLAEAYLAAANRVTQANYELDLLEDAIDMLTDERDELKAHWAYCTRGCDACNDALEMLKDTP